MSQQQNKIHNTSAVELREVSSFRGSVERAVYAGVKEQEGWKPNTMVSLEDFEKASARFMSS